MSKHNEFNANTALAAARHIHSERRKTPRPLSRPEREIREMNRIWRLAVVCGTLAALFPAYVALVEIFVK